MSKLLLGLALILVQMSVYAEVLTPLKVFTYSRGTAEYKEIMELKRVGKDEVDHWSCMAGKMLANDVETGVKTEFYFTSSHKCTSPFVVSTPVLVIVRDKGFVTHIEDVCYGADDNLVIPFTPNYQGYLDDLGIKPLELKDIYVGELSCSKKIGKFTIKEIVSRSESYIKNLIIENSDFELVWNLGREIKVHKSIDDKDIK